MQLELDRTALENREENRHPRGTRGRQILIIGPGDRQADHDHGRRGLRGANERQAARIVAQVAHLQSVGPRRHRYGVTGARGVLSP